jgi:hypothetical protein
MILVFMLELNGLDGLKDVGHVYAYGIRRWLLKHSAIV